MTDIDFGSLLVVAVAAFVVPVLLVALPGPRIPSVVGEVVAGIALGASGAGLIDPSAGYLEFLFLFGLAFLLFLAGLEFDPEALHGTLAGGVRRAVRTPLGRALLGMAIRLVVAFAITLLYRDEFGSRDCAAAGALQSAQMTLTVAGVEIGRQLGIIDEALGAALIGVALLTVLIAPIAFARLHAEAAGPAAAEAPPRVA
jgi:Kef-type K+ transport system membrane component KefB